MTSQSELFDLLISMKYKGEDLDFNSIELIINMNEFETVNEVVEFMKFYSDVYPNLNEIFHHYLNEVWLNKLNQA